MGFLYVYMCKYICIEVYVNFIVQSCIIYFVVMSFGENMWGEIFSIFLLIIIIFVWKEKIFFEVFWLINFLYKNFFLGCYYMYFFQYSLVYLLIRVNGYKLEN